MYTEKIDCYPNKMKPIWADGPTESEIGIFIEGMLSDI